MTYLDLVWNFVIDTVIRFALGFAVRLWRVIDYVFTVADTPYLTLRKRQRLSITGHGQQAMQNYKIRIGFVVALVAGHFSHKMAVNVNA